MARTSFLGDQMGSCKVPLGKTIVSSFIHAASSRETDNPNELARVANHIKAYRQTLPDYSASAAISGQRNLTFLWTNDAQVSFPL